MPMLILASTCGWSRAAPPRMSAVAPVEVPAHVSFLSDVALTMPPDSLSSVVGILVDQGESIVDPGSDASLHPLVRQRMATRMNHA